MTNKNLVSIIMPIFNPNKEYFQKSIKSILSQNYEEIELIIVFDKYNIINDELTISYLDEFSDDHRFKLVVNGKRIGFTRSLNKGIELSKGEYIGRMDGDDISSVFRIQEQVKFLEQEQLDLIGCWSKVINETGADIGYLSPPHKWSTIRKYLLFHNPFIHSSLLFRRQVIRNVGLYRPDFEPSEDYEFYLRAFSKGCKGGNVPRYLHSWREHFSSVMHSNKWKRNRLEYLRCKFTAVTKYGFNKPLDIVFLGMAPLSIFIKPESALKIKEKFNFLGNYQS